MIIGIGSAGKNICDLLKETVNDNFLVLDEHNVNPSSLPWSMEEYERRGVLEESWLDPLTDGDECVILTSSGGNIQGILLRTLELIKRKTDNILIFYFKPDLELLSTEQKLKYRPVFGILQEMVRTGSAREICLFDNKLLSKLDSEIDIFNYEESINKVIVDLILWKMSCLTEKPYKGKITERPEHQNISSIEFHDLDSITIIESFKLNSVKHVNNYIFLNKEKTSKNKINDILHIIQYNNGEGVNSSYCIVENKQNILIKLNYTSIIQEY